MSIYNLLILRGFMVRDQEVDGSNPLAPTNLFNSLTNHIQNLWCCPRRSGSAVRWIPEAKSGNWV
jgi:hypothetical protein